MNNKKGSGIMQVIQTVLLAIAIASLIFTSITLIKNKEIISKDPLIYGMGLHNFTVCSCIDQQGKQWESTETGFMRQEYPDNFVNYSKVNVNYSKFVGGDNGTI